MKMMIDTTTGSDVTQSPDKDSRPLEEPEESSATKQTSSEPSFDQTNASAEEGTLCIEHNLPLNFWQEKEQVYACIKCLIDEKEVHFVDKSY